MNSDSELVVSDFGLGLDVDAETTRRTTVGQMLGTFGYIAPEQLGDAKHATPHSDIFSLGRILPGFPVSRSLITV